MSTLCEYCRGMPFYLLTCPTATELREIRHAQRNGLPNYRDLKYGKSPITGYKNKAQEASVSLGPVSRILRYDGPCELCRLFRDIINQRGARCMYDAPIPDNDDNILIEATFDRQYYAFITESMRDYGSSSLDGLRILRRLSLRVHYAKDTMVNGREWPNAYPLSFYNKVLQACHPDDFLATKNPQAALQTEHEVDSLKMLFRGRKRPALIDPDLLREWMRVCEADHDITCYPDEDLSINTNHTHFVKLIRFINVENNCLQVIRDIDLTNLQYKYVALSYVWGRSVHFKLDIYNETSLQAKDSLKKVKLPQTIQDAIDLTRLLHIKYLWVDVLCLCQGKTDLDIKDRQYQLGNMGRIYHEASLTIIAACGDNANAGLMGLRSPRIFEQQAVTVIQPSEDHSGAGLALVTTCNSCPVWTGFRSEHHPNDDGIDISVWGTRAWTVQERCLSRRCLIFTPDQVYWVCDGALFCEESYFEHPTIYERNSMDTPLRVEIFKNKGSILSFKTIDGPLARLTTTRQTFWTQCASLVESYCRRNMTRDGDIHDAFQGILEALTRISGEDFHWGHPKSRLGMSLTWKSPAFYYKLRRRTAKTTLPMTSLKAQVILPSWSWMGWLGPVNFRVDDDTLETQTINLKYFSHQSSPLCIIPVIGSNRLDEVYSGTPIEKPKYGRQKGTAPPRDQNSDIITWDDIQKNCPKLTEFKLQCIPDGHVLFFWTFSASFVVERPQFIDSTDEEIATIARNLPNLSHAPSTNVTEKSVRTPGQSIDGTEEILNDIGAAMKSDEESSTSKMGLVKTSNGLVVGFLDRMGKEHWDSLPSPEGLQEFIVVGRTAVEGMTELYPAYVVALQIYREDGIAYRVNIAEFKESDWEAANPVRKLIALM